MKYSNRARRFSATVFTLSKVEGFGRTMMRGHVGRATGRWNPLSGTRSSLALIVIARHDTLFSGGGKMDRLIRMMAGLASLVALLAAPLAAVAADSPPLAAYGELPAVEDAAISPTGKKIAVVGTFDGRRALVVLDEQLNMTRNSAVGDLKLRGVEWIGDESILLVTSETEDLGRGFTTD